MSNTGVRRTTHCARCTLAAVNTLFFFAGLATLVAASYVLSLSFMTDPTPMGWACAAGVFLILLSLGGSIGSCCAKPSSTRSLKFKLAIVLYVFLVVVIVLAMMAGGGVLLAWHGELSSFSPAKAAATDVERRVESWAASYYNSTECCPLGADSPAGTTCRVMFHDFDCGEGFEAFRELVKNILQATIFPAGVVFLVLSFLAVSTTSILNRLLSQRS